MINYEGYPSRDRWLGTASLGPCRWQPLLCPAWTATQIGHLAFQAERCWDLRPGWEALRQRLWGRKGVYCFVLSFRAVPNCSQESKWTRKSLASRSGCSHCVLDFTQAEPGAKVCVLWQGRYSKPIKPPKPQHSSLGIEAKAAQTKLHMKPCG